MSGHLERRLEELRKKLAAHNEVKLVIEVMNFSGGEPTFIAIGGSDAAKAAAIAEARRRWREAPSS